MSQNSWFILKKESQLQRLNKLLKEYPFIEMSGESIYLRLGYKNLSLGDKETYFLLRDLALFSNYKYKTNDVEPSLDYLAKCLGTSTKTQSIRLQNLEKTELIKKVRRKFHTNIYSVNTQPLPDSTFVSTLVILIRRKRVLNLIEKYRTSSNNSDKKEIINQLSSLNQNLFYKKIIKNIPKVKEILAN